RAVESNPTPLFRDRSLMRAPGMWDEYYALNAPAKAGPPGSGPGGAWFLISRTLDSALENVLSSVTYKGEFVQYPSITGVDCKQPFSSRRFPSQSDQGAFYFRFCRILCTLLLKHHDVRVATHGMKNLVLSLR